MTLRMSPTAIQKFRNDTKSDANPLLSVRMGRCCKCKKDKPREGGKLTKNFSRHEPGRFYCKECL